MKNLMLHLENYNWNVSGYILWSWLYFFQAVKFLSCNFIKPFGTIFINLLKLIFIPFNSSLIKGVSDLKDISKLSKMVAGLLSHICLQLLLL